MEFFENFNWYSNEYHYFQFNKFHRLIAFILYIIFLLIFEIPTWQTKSGVKCSWILLFGYLCILYFAKSFSRWHAIAASFEWILLHRMPNEKLFAVCALRCSSGKISQWMLKYDYYKFLNCGNIFIFSWFNVSVQFERMCTKYEGKKKLKWELQIQHQLNVWIKMVHSKQQTWDTKVSENIIIFFERNMIYTWSSITNIKFVYPVEYVQCSLLYRIPNALSECTGIWYSCTNVQNEPNGMRCSSD